MISNQDPSTRSLPRLRGVRRVALAIVIVAIILLAGRLFAAKLPDFSQWVDTLGFWGPLAFIGGYSIATVAFIPGSVLTLAAGAIFGLFQGTVLVFVGATIGSVLAFLVSRHLARGLVERALARRPRFRSLDGAVASSGFRIVILLRLSPLFPFNVLNYALGLTRIRLRDYLAASVGMLPATFLYVYYGTAIGSLARIASGSEVERGSGHWLVLGIGLAATVAATSVVTRIARRALAQELDNG